MTPSTDTPQCGLSPWHHNNNQYNPLPSITPSTRAVITIFLLVLPVRRPPLPPAEPQAAPAPSLHLPHPPAPPLVCAALVRTRRCSRPPRRPRAPRHRPTPSLRPTRRRPAYDPREMRHQPRCCPTRSSRPRCARSCSWLGWQPSTPTRHQGRWTVVAWWRAVVERRDHADHGPATDLGPINKAPVVVFLCPACGG